MVTKKHASEDFVIQPFKDLKKIIESKKKTVPPEPSLKKEEALPDDETVFMNAMEEVQEISEFRELPVYQKEIAAENRSRSCDNEALITLQEIITGKRPVYLPDTPEYVEWINPQYRGNIIQRLHEGKYSVQDYLDLHGSIVEEAEFMVRQFLDNSLRNGLHCIKIIHGRGLRSPNGPVLKDAVIKWLISHYRKNIVAFVSARQCDGGLGALYILFR